MEDVFYVCVFLCVWAGVCGGGMWVDRWVRGVDLAFVKVFT